MYRIILMVVRLFYKVPYYLMRIWWLGTRKNFNLEENYAFIKKVTKAANRAGRVKIESYGHFKNVRNYIALVGKKSDQLSEQCGYYGEKLVLFAQTLGLRTCWVGASYRKRKAAFQLEDSEKCCLVIAIGYGAEDGVPHHSKSLESVIRIKDEMPHWFEKGVQAALLAPTAVNQQKFLFTLVNDHTVRAGAGWGLYTEVDLGIVKYHFELAAGDHFEWAES